MSGARGRAIREAVDDQLGVDVAEIKPIGSEASKGSTPMRLFTVDRETGDVGPVLFAKLLARSHLRSDRWYKLGRTLLYGRLEDEGKFQTVRRLVQQEDYLGLRIAEAGIHVPKTYGVVELTPEREYLLVTGFLDGYQEIGEAELSIAAIDNALGVVRKLWDAGLAHRDIKPGNLMVRDDDVALIDVSFGEIRPSPWRQAVDLANIMLVLALRSDADTVYERALLQFTPTDIGEAFAATRGVTLPSQLRDDMKADGRDLIGRFRELAPTYPPISIQLWSWRRVGLIVWVLFVRRRRGRRRARLPAARRDAAVRKVVVRRGGRARRGGRDRSDLGESQSDTSRRPTSCRAPCVRPTRSNELVAQSVPSASLVPCVVVVRRTVVGRRRGLHRRTAPRCR